MNAILNDKDEMVMSLVHYFVTEENYTPINVRGVKNEIWLENLESPYKIVRINSNYIHNEEQLDIDKLKMEYVIKQIKKKTLSLKMNALNICLNINDSLSIQNDEKSLINTVCVNDLKDVKSNSFLNKLFPNIKTNKLKKADDIGKIIGVTTDINKKTEEENQKYENVFRPKKLVITYLLIAICVFMYVVTCLIDTDFNYALLLLGANNQSLVIHGQIWRLLTSAFLHGSLMHLFVNMYSLLIIGGQVESYMGKVRYLVIYILSALMGSLFSVLFLGNSISIGASGAIFGLAGSLLYFGYHYRLYLSNALTSQIIPVIVVNLLLGFFTTGIDNAAHIGGLIGGYLATMIVGVKYKPDKRATINGIIVYLLLIAFLFYALFNFI